MSTSLGEGEGGGGALPRGYMEVSAGCSVMNPSSGGGDERDDAELLREVPDEKDDAPPVLQSLAIELLKYGNSVDTWSEALQRSLLQLEEDPDSIPVRCAGHDSQGMV